MVGTTRIVHRKRTWYTSGVASVVDAMQERRESSRSLVRPALMTFRLVGGNESGSRLEPWVCSESLRVPFAVVVVQLGPLLDILNSTQSEPRDAVNAEQSSPKIR